MERTQNSYLLRAFPQSKPLLGHNSVSQNSPHVAQVGCTGTELPRVNLYNDFFRQFYRVRLKEFDVAIMVQQSEDNSSKGDVEEPPLRRRQLRWSYLRACLRMPMGRRVNLFFQIVGNAPVRIVVFFKSCSRIALVYY